MVESWVEPRDALECGGELGPSPRRVRPVDWVLERPMFIIGAERSGTSWLQSMLARDRRFVGGCESHFFSVAPSLKNYRYLMGSHRAIGPSQYVDESLFVEHVRRLWRDMFGPMVRSKPAAEMLVEKTPSHALMTDLIAEIFPRAKFLHLVRDGRAVALSMNRAHREGWGRRWAPATFKQACWRWERYVAAARTAAALGSDRYLEVRYEELVDAPETGRQRIASFAGVGHQGSGAVDAAESPSADEPAGFARRVPPDQWRREISWSQRVIARKSIGRQLFAMGYPRW